jgi:hypothetical protein
LFCVQKDCLVQVFACIGYKYALFSDQKLMCQPFCCYFVIELDDELLTKGYIYVLMDLYGNMLPSFSDCCCCFCNIYYTAAGNWKKHYAGIGFLLVSPRLYLPVNQSLMFS